MSLILTKILNEFSMKKKQGNIYPIDRKLDYYSPRKTIQKRQATITPTLDEILEHGLVDLEQLMQIYSLINYKIEAVKYGADVDKQQLNGTQIIERYDGVQYNSLLSLKSYIFHKLHLPESSLNEPNQWSINGFRVPRLLQFYKQLTNIQKIVSKQLSINDKDRILLIQAGYLLNQISQLIKQVKTAAFPFPEKRFLNFAELYFFGVQETIELAEAQQQIVVDQLKQLNDFKLIETDYFQNALRYLDHQINKLSIKIENKLPIQSIKYSVSQRTFDDLEGYSLIIRKDQIMCIKIKFEMTKFVCQKFGVEYKQLKEITKIFNEDPLSQFEKKQLESIKHGLQDYPIDCSMYSVFFYKTVNILRKDHYNFLESEQYPKLLIKLIQICENCLILSRQEQPLVYQNYIQVIKLYSQIDKKYISSRLNELYQTFAKYVKLLKNNLSGQKQKIKEQLIKVDEGFTYSLLVSDKILQNIQRQKDEILQAIDKAVPLLEIISQISSLQPSQFKDKNKFVQQILLKVFYTSLLNQESIQRLTRKGKKDNCLQKIITLSESSTILEQIPHLLQLRNIIILLEIISNHNSQGKNRQETQKITSQYLSQISQYFVIKRQCKIYNLKSKILFFIALFKMGYYIPKYIEEGNVIDLRPRILNLFTNLSSQNNANLFMSRLPQSMLKNSKIQASIYPSNDDESNLIQNEGSLSNILNLSASPQLKAKIQEVIEQTYSKWDSNWKQYIANRLNIMEHQLFTQQKKRQKRQQEYLAREYQQHICNCLKSFDEAQFNNNRFQALITIQKYFYLEKYEQGWEILIKQIKSNAQFSNLVDKLLASTNKSMELFKFLKIFRSFATYFDQMNPHAQSKKDLKNKNIQEIIRFINKESMFQIEREPIIVLYQYCMKYQKIERLQSLCKERDNKELILTESLNYSKASSKQPSEPSLIQVSLSNQHFFPSQVLQDIDIKLQIQIDNHRLKPFGVRVIKNRQFIYIQIGKKFESLFTSIRDKLSIFIGVEKAGVYQIKSIKNISGKKWNQSLIIQLQENPFVASSTDNLSDQQKWIKSSEEYLIKNVLKKIIEVNNVYLKNENNIDLKQLNSELNVNVQESHFCINPFYLLLQNILAKTTTRRECPFQLQIQAIQSLVAPIRSQFSPFFSQNYDYFIHSFKKSAKDEIINLLHLPMFKSKDDTISLLLNTESKLSNLYKPFHDQLLQLSKQKANTQRFIEKCQLILKNPIYKKYCYHFGVGSTLQLQILELKGVKLNLANVLNNIKRQILSKNNSQDIVLRISKQYPMMLTIIDAYSNLFDLTYEQIIKNKIDFLKKLFTQKNIPNKLRQFCKNHSSTREITMLQNYKIIWNKINTKLQGSLKSYTCFKCKKMYSLFSQQPIKDLFDFLQRLSKTETPNNVNQNYFVNEHAVKNCFLREQFKAHPMIKAVATKINMPGIFEPKYYIVVSWWFFLESNFPNLLDILKVLADEISQ